MSYQLIAGSELIKRQSDGALIPPDPGNRAYQEYQAWLAEGNAPEPAAAPPPAPDFQLFLDTIIASPLYQKVLLQASASLPINVAFTTVMGALILAANGRPNVEALQSGFDALLGAMTLEPGDIEALRSIAAGANLGAVLHLPT